MQTQAEVPLTVSVAIDPGEREIAMRYIHEKMRASFGCEPPTTTGVIFVVKEGARIVGSLVLEGSQNDEPFGIESHYDFDPERSPFPYVRDHIIQAVRWTGSRAHASRMVALATMQVSLAMGKRYIMIEAKPYSVKRLHELGMDFREIEGASLRMDHIRSVVGEDGMTYFTEQPAPSLFLMDIAAGLRANGL